MKCTTCPLQTTFKMTTIDFRTMPANVPSLCIPRVFPNIDERRIRRVFDELAMGEIERIDIVKKTTDKGEKFNRVFIHWKRWNDSANSNQARERLLNGKEIKIIYDDPWFWKISAYRESSSTRPAAPRPVGGAAARILFEDDDRSARPQPRDDRRPQMDNSRPQRDNRVMDDRRPSRPQRDDRRPQRDDRRGPRRPEQRLSSPVRRPRSPVRRPRSPERRPEPTTPDCSPPRPERVEDEHEQRQQDYESDPKPITLDYSGLPPPPKKLTFKSKKAAVVIKEEGEI